MRLILALLGGNEPKLARARQGAARRGKARQRGIRADSRGFKRGSARGFSQKNARLCPELISVTYDHVAAGIQAAEGSAKLDRTAAEVGDLLSNGIDVDAGGGEIRKLDVVIYIYRKVVVGV